MAWFSPYLLAEGQVDTRSFDHILADKRFAGKRDHDLAVALWQWLVDPREGFYHFLNPVEEPGETLAGDPVKDPLRLLNSYGYGLCGSVAMIFASLYDWAGGEARLVGATGHSISEAYWDGSWHLIDCDLRAIHYKKTEHGVEVASLADLVSRPDLVTQPAQRSDPYYLPPHSPEGVAESVYAPGRQRYLPRYFCRLGSMDYVLRPAESITFYYQPQSRFNWPEKWQTLRRKADQGPFFGPQDRADPSRRYANACIRWRPDLKADLEAVGVECRGFTQGPIGLVAESSEAAVKYRLVSPYVISGRCEAFDPQRRRVDGLLVRIAASAEPAVRLALARDGTTVQAPVQREGTQYLADLTAAADGHYEYELVVSVPAGAEVYDIAVDTWCQVAVRALPRWGEPGRAVRLVCGAEGGRAVLGHLVDLIARLRDGGGRLDAGHLGDSATAKLIPADGDVRAMVALEPPVPGRIVRVHAMAAIGSVKDSAEAAGEVVLEVASRPAGPFVPVDRQAICVDPDEYHFSVEGLYVFEEPPEKVWLQIRSPRPVGLWRARIDYEPQRPAEPAAPIEVLLRWRQDGELRSLRRLVGPQEVGATFVAVPPGRAVEPLHVVLSVPSNGRQDGAAS